MKRFPGSLLLLLLSAFPVFGRVVSYAPYTNLVAQASFQERTSRHFVLVETTPSSYFWGPGAVMLYDSTGAEEPRDITPAPDRFDQTALYEKEGQPPVILAISYSAVRVSVGGAQWKKVAALGTSLSVVDTLDADTGGPFTHGLFAPITIGSDAWPFVVTLQSKGVWAINRDGNAKQLLPSGARVIGRNAAGTRFLIQYDRAIWSAAPDGEIAKVATVAAGPYYAGWLTSDGTAYVISRTYNSRSLSRSNPKTLTLDPIGGTDFLSYPVYPGTIPPVRWFAVPTQDYDGAWIIERKTGQPTRLLRHTSAGMETMWSDVSAPQVEALISGKSGQTVLVQVHREREGVELTAPFIDPALAVWRVGEREPRVYDELYLNEEWNKGFVHVDADRIESGDGFVFDSGFKLIEPSPSRVSAPIGGGGDVIQEWGVVRASLKQRLVLPGVARLPGAFASSWATDVTIYNPLPDKQDVEVRFIALGADSFVDTTITLDPYEIRAIPDVLATLFSIDAAGGALHLLPATGVNAIARTYSRRGAGTFGFGMQAVDYYNSIGPRFKVSFSGAFPGDNFRTNILLTDTSGRGTQATLRAYTNAGALDVTGGVGLATPPQGTMQMNAISGDVGLRALQGGALVVEPTRGSAISTVVAIDNRTNDPTYFPPDIPGTIPRAIPVIGHLDGANGAKFRSDLYVYNPGPNWRSVNLIAKMWNSPVSTPARLQLGPYESRVVTDVLKSLFGREGVASLRYAGQEGEIGEAIRLTSRTYTVNADGGTYGCLVPPLNAFQIGTFGDHLEILGVSGGPGFRTNIGLVDLNERSSRNPTVRLRIVDDQHRTLDVMTVEIPARGGMQLNDIFTARGITPPPAALLIVEILDGQQIAAYATLTDNTTNDPIYLQSQLGAQPEAN